MEKLEVRIVDPPRPGILNVMDKIRPEWNSEDIVITKMEGGILNHVYKCELAEDGVQDDVIIIRVYGEGSEIYIDRERECLVMRMAHSAGLGAQVYCRFKNGLVYRFMRGMPVTESNIKQERIGRAVARKLASLHELNIGKILIELGEEAWSDKYIEPFKWSDYLRKSIASVPELYPDAHKSKIRRDVFPGVTEAVAVVENLEHELSAMNFPTALVHGDPYPNNCVYESDTEEVHLIDWEFSGVHNPPTDIGIYFVGIWFATEEPLALYPDKEYQLKWIRWYLEYQAELVGQDPDGITEDQVLHWYRGSINCALQYTQTIAFFLLGQDVLWHSDPAYFRRAQQVQRLFYIILNDHYRKISPK